MLCFGNQPKIFGHDCNSSSIARIRIQSVDYLLTSTSFSVFTASLLPSIAAAM